jgi:leader peptidase (prepilin peptidase)/N-methyltransferase
LDGPAAGLLAALLGLVFGSFATAASYRLPRLIPLASGRSICPGCGKTLGGWDLIPLLSWLRSGGRCRHCGETISWRYPAIEAVTAALFVLIWARVGADFGQLALLWLTATGLVIITVADFEAGIIPDKVLLVLAPVALGLRWLTGQSVAEAMGTAVVAMALAFALRIGFRRLRGYDGLGMGDVKFLGVAGLYLGSLRMAGFIILAGLLGVVLGLGWRLSGRGAVFPFGPALTLSLLLGVLFPEWLDAIIGVLPS